MRWNRSEMMWRKDDGIKLSWIEVDLQGDRCFTIIQGFRDGLIDDGGGWVRMCVCVGGVQY